MLSDGMSEPMLQPGRRPRKERRWREAIVTSDAASTVGMLSVARTKGLAPAGPPAPSAATCACGAMPRDLVANSGFLPVGRLRRPRPAGLFLFAFVATALYRLLKHAHPNAALASVALVT